MRLTAYFSQPNYARHGMPIVEALRARGAEVDCWARDSGASWGPPYVDLFREQVGPLVMVASHQDARLWHDRRLIYVEHGAGQTYEVDERLGVGFPGGDGLDHVALFLAPSQRVARRWQARYPQAAVEVVGCPALDRYFADEEDRDETEASRAIRGEPLPSRAVRVLRHHPGAVLDGAGRAARGGIAGGARAASALGDLEGKAADLVQQGTAAPVVAITAHHPTFGDIPECRPALPHYDAALPHLRIDLARAGIELVGHAHPRGHLAMVRRWENLGVRYEPDPDVILSTASLLIVDNSSIAYEAAAVDLPVLSLNSPAYRRDVHHGLRFWSHIPGLQCDEPADLARMVYEALADPPEASALRTRAAHYAYDHLDGRAADRAADAIISILEEGASMPETNSQHLGEVIDRLYQLGATDDIVNALRDAQPDEQSAEVERLRRLNDAVLASEVAMALAAHDVRDSDLDVMDADQDLDGAALELLSLDSDEEVLAAVGTDAELAARLFRLESAQPEPSVPLLAALAGVAGIAYEPPVVEPPVGQESGEDLGDEQVVEPG